MKKLFLLAIFVCVSMLCAAQAQIVDWSWKVTRTGEGTAKVVFTGHIQEGYHTYSITAGTSRTEIIEVKTKGCSINGALKEEGNFADDNGKLICSDEIRLVQDIRLTDKSAQYSGCIAYFVCEGQMCKPESWNFTVKIGEAPASKPARKSFFIR
ncbi:MAG: hypothetical protein ACI3Z0_04555 [Candidatus Cryptobacteroides sp.]